MPSSQQSLASTKPIEKMEHSISGFFQHQNETLKVHQHYLDQQGEYARTFYQLMQQRIELASQGTAIPPEVEEQMQMFHAHQSETLRVHEQYLNQQSEQTQSALKITELQLGGSGQKLAQASAIVPVVQKSAPVKVQEPLPIFSNPISVASQHTSVSTPTVPPVSSTPTVAVSTTLSAASSAISSEEITGVMMAIVCEKTGYPLEMLELGMDMESDLGIDSIKRVEILGELQDKIPELPEVPGDELAEMRTLGEIVTYLQIKLGVYISNGQKAETTLSGMPATKTSDVSSEGVTASMMAIVCEKTGYPLEMLELGMDMESDLGIDSIKRVEILGELQDKIPELPEVPGDELAEMRTLGQIIDHLKSKIGRDSSETSREISSTVTTPNLELKNQNPTTVTGQDPGQVFMSIISEKTGYPTEMLELGMDIEADLGIDSIKRVEIMWSLQEKFKDLPQIGANEVAELRTVGQIIEHIKSLLPALSEKDVFQDPNLKSEPDSFSASPNYPSGNGNGGAGGSFDLVTGEIAPSLLAIIAEKTGYPLEMLEMHMDMESDLGIDSIKRVEIMWSLQEQLPHLPLVSSSEMSELRTLKEIVDHLSLLSPSETPRTKIISTPDSSGNQTVKKNS